MKPLSPLLHLKVNPMEKESSYAVEMEYGFFFFAFHASPSSKEVKEIFFFVCAWNNALLFMEEEKVQHFVHERKIPLLFLKEWEETYDYESDKIFPSHFFHFLKRNGNLKRYVVALVNELKE